MKKRIFAASPCGRADSTGVFRACVPIVAALAGLMLSSCTSSKLYYWGAGSTYGTGTTKYENLAYKSYDKQTPQSFCELLCLYEDMVTHPGGSRGVVPPGIYAEYGYLLMLPSTAETFEKYATPKQKKMFSSSNYATSFAQKGEEMLKKEMELYPESAKFIEPILKRLSK